MVHVNQHCHPHHNNRSPLILLGIVVLPFVQYPWKIVAAFYPVWNPPRHGRGAVLVRTITITNAMNHPSHQQQQQPTPLDDEPSFSPIVTTNYNKNNKNEQSSLPLLSLPISGPIQQTLAPCVVLMKEWMGKYSDQWTGDRGGIYSLAQGVVYWDPPTVCNEALCEALREDTQSSSSSFLLHRYGPDEGLLELRKAVMEKLVRENNFTTTQQHHHQVMITVGANQAYMNCVLTLLDARHHKAVVFAPYYFNHVMALQMVLPDSSSLLIGPSNDQGIPDLTWLRQQLQQDDTIQMVTLVNPGNPTGVILSRDTLQQAVDLCREYQCWLILDCTYEYFVSTPSVEDNVYGGCFPNDPHVIHIFSFSKSYALAGYRCGYIVLSNDAHPGLYDQMMKVQDTIPIAPSRIAQIAALAAVRQAGRGWVAERVRTLNEGRECIRKALATMHQPIMGGSGAMYMMVKLPVPNDQEIAEMLVRDYGVAVIPGSFCGFPGWIRVCYANLPPEACTRAAARLEEGLKSLMVT